ncbi:MAG: 16S rRNA (uracil(1498)-N(3))-methyltransferase [Clostridiales bacterium]|nr:16S rRNA (uracil(1498)-N(3))-methyltransferase [Clostridiales bacterium]
MSRFFVEPRQVGEKTILIESREDLHHMIKVLRLGVGDIIEVSDTQEWEYTAAIESLDTDGAEAKIIDKQSFANEPVIKVTLFQGVPKQGKMEGIIQKCVELGVNCIVPVFMERSVVTEKGNFHKKRQRWQRISSEAVKQCKRGIVPHVGEAMKTDDMIGTFHEFDLVLFPYENEAGTTIKDVLTHVDDTATRVAVIIGPEGGFSHGEAEAIVEAGGRSLSLGRTTLRTETAGMAVLAMVMYELEL